MIIPCIDVMDGKAVQLVQGRDKALEEDSPLAVLERFRAFPQIQVIDLDAALNRGANDELIRTLAAQAVIRAGGGVRSFDRARSLIGQGAHRVIIGTAAFSETGIEHNWLAGLADAIGPDRVLIALDSRDGCIVTRGWKSTTRLRAHDVIRELEPYCSGFLCTYVDKEGMMQGTDLEWFQDLRNTTDREITAAGGITTLEDIRALQQMNVHAAIGMAIYTGRLSLEELAAC
ncbi:HisA/HisF-related TIM barrel protein [Nevskia soli]|uniref:1-(5-phosphoribosyl)-5-[(5- phosphoribosylamino)methylideneamino]imidazole-4- carboxamide isomerase n=1 Tax=Nevskia soli TaxID=418856 RepID=UPI0015D94A46|nr:1-(5-phosphoribosyl)-5-[(5-phosphoribosylamino)methylideneamino] imidazole-4-carboxamide isomerase [Nevskia soli]